MIKVNKIDNEEMSGYQVVMLLIFSVTCTYSTHRGEHISLGFGLLSLETIFGFSIWDKALP